MTLFNRDALRTYDKWSIRVYCIISLLFGLILVFGSDEAKKLDIVYYTIGTQFFLYFFNYKSLRNLKVFGFWALMSILHLGLYFILRDDPLLMLAQVHAAIGLRNTIILLMLFQLLRFVSLAVQNEELVCPSKGSNADLLDNREATFIDGICLVIYITALIVLLQY